MSDVVLQEATKKQAAEFAKRTREIIRRVGKMDEKMVKQAVSYLTDARRQIAEELLTVQGFDQLHLTQILRNVEQALEEMRRRFNGSMQGGIKDAWSAGASVVDVPLQAAGITIPARGFVDPQLVEFMQEYSASLIGRASKEAIGRIDTILRAGVIGRKSPQEIMREIGKVLKTRTQADVERIARTEINRALNLSYDARVKDVKAQLKGLKKFWLHTNDTRTRDSHVAVGRATNPAYGGTPIPVDEPYDVGGYEADSPYDVKLPAEETINCRCRSILIVDEETEKQ